MVDSELIWDNPDVWDFSAKKRRNRPASKTPQEGGNSPWRPTRRELLGAVVATAGLYLGWRFLDNSSESRPTTPLSTPQPLAIP